MAGQPRGIRDGRAAREDVPRRRRRTHRAPRRGASDSRTERDLNDRYRSIASRSEFRHKIERSEFLGIAFPVSQERDFFAALTAIAKEHFDATHHCWAFRLFHDARSRSSDAGEPSGTAGRPILSAIEGADVFDAAVVVVRWFGGVKLGTGGLSRAYRQMASSALAGATIVDHYVYESLTVVASFDRMSDVYRLVDPPNIVLAAERFGETNAFDFNVRRSRVEEFRATLRARRLTLR